MHSKESATVDLFFWRSDRGVWRTYIDSNLLLNDLMPMVDSLKIFYGGK